VRDAGGGKLRVGRVARERCEAGAVELEQGFRNPEVHQAVAALEEGCLGMLN